MLINFVCKGTKYIVVRKISASLAKILSRPEKFVPLHPKTDIR